MRQMLRFSLILLSIPYFSINVNCYGSNLEAEPITTDQQQETLEKLQLKALDQLKMVDATIEDLATVVSNDIVNKIKDKSDHVTKLRLVRDIITNLTGSSYVVVNPYSIHALTHITRSIANFILDNIDDGFYELEYFDLSYIRIPQVENITIEELLTNLTDNDELISELDHKAANIGLCWYNKIYRTAKKRLLHPWRKYNLGPISLVGGISAAAGFLLLYNYGGSYFPQSIRSWKIGDKYVFGWPLEKNEQGFIRNDAKTLGESQVGQQKKIKDLIDKASTNELKAKVKEEFNDLPYVARPAGSFGYAEDAIAKIFYTNNLPITASACMAANYFGKLLYPSVALWASHKIKAADNFMMGGAYKHRPVGDIQYLSKVNFDDVIGCKEAKKIGNELCLYLKDPERFDRSKLTPAKGYLLVGETRTGKSYFVESLLGELQRNMGTGFGSFKIYKISYAAIESKGIDTILALAKNYAPCILFIDEIDLLGLQRSQDRKRLSEFLTAMSGYLSEIDPDKAVIIVGATNKQESIDFALTQPGRFGVIMPFERPTFEERKEFIKRELTKLAVNIDLFDIDKLARESEGYVFEAIGLVIKKAMINAKIHNEPISQAILERSFDETIRGILEDATSIPEEQKEMLATHMAGHTLINILLKPRLKVNKVTIQKVRSNIKEQAMWVQAWTKEEEKQKPTEYGKIFFNHEKDALEFENKEELIKQCKGMLAGHVAERVLLGQCSYTYHADDRQRALKMTQSTVFGGLPMDQLPKEVKNNYLTESYNLMVACEQEVEALLQEHKEELATLTQALKEKGTLGIRAINNLLYGPEETTTKKKSSEATLSEIIGQAHHEEQQSQPAVPTA